LGWAGLSSSLTQEGFAKSTYKPTGRSNTNANDR
jgi:hypothetical protein